ncbi:MAG: hypothetical protein K6L80_06670 [Agarilytica sp.]
MNRLIFTSMLLTFSALSNADGYDAGDKTLFFDQPSTAIQHQEFNDLDPLKPYKNDFQIVEISHLSNNLGERWTLITFKNTASGQRILKNEHVIATFADGSRSAAINLKATLTAGELLTRTVFFGTHKFPIIKVSVNR